MDISDAEEIVHTYSYDGPQPYNYNPAMLPREQGYVRMNVRQNNQRQIELWCEENQRRTGQVSWCLCVQIESRSE